MIKVGITGQPGFIGTHLYNLLSLEKNKYQLIPFQDSFFDNEELLARFVCDCDVIVHLAAVNRHHNKDEIYKTNLLLTDKLITALNKCNSTASIIFSSSIQEERDNAYGRSKKISREKLAEWAGKTRAGFTGLVIPNVFGSFGRPFYNSVISTFSYQLCNNEIPKIEIDTDLKLIYIDELLAEIKIIIDRNETTVNPIYEVHHTSIAKVSDLFEKLQMFKTYYLADGVIPDLSAKFDLDLFNTFRSYIDLNKHFPFRYKPNKDERGIFVELIKQRTGGQVSYSTTKPGITRGNHFHTRKIERFSVIKGDALIQMRKYGTKEVYDFELNGNTPSFVDMPVWYSHNITNIGKDELVTLFYINELYNPDDPDTYFCEV